MSFSEWKEYKWGELCTLEYGKGLKGYKEMTQGIPVYGTNGHIGYSNKALCNKEGVIIGRKGAYRGVHYSKEAFYVIDTAFYLNILDESMLNMKFAYYHLLTKDINSMDSGSAIPSTSRPDFYNLGSKIPPIHEQKAIANILSALDEKIELNTQMNKTLEEMAQALFKRWFVDFEFPNEDGEAYKSSGGEMVDSELGIIPKGWEARELEDLLVSVKQPVKAGEHLRDLPYLPIDTLPMKTLSVKEFKSWEEAKSSLISFEQNDILLGAMRVYFHRVCLAPFEGITRTTCFVLRPKDKELHAYLTMKLFDEETINFANSTSKGTTMPYAVWENGLNRMKVVTSTKDVNKKFAEAVDGILQRIRDSLFENIYLQELRDILLPKLMSGEIRVTDLQN